LPGSRRPRDERSAEVQPGAWIAEDQVAPVASSNMQPLPIPPSKQGEALPPAPPQGISLPAPTVPTPPPPTPDAARPGG
jgi:hypothetical protein